jgi:hypothetical protein
MEEKINQMDDIADKDGLINAIRKLVLDEVDEKVQEKAEVMWQKGTQMLTSIQAKHKEKTEGLMNEVTQFRQRQAVLEAENANLKMVLRDLVAKFQILGAMPFGGGTPKAVNVMGAAEGSTLASTTCSNADSPPFLTPQTEVGHTADGQKLPDVPEFPFPAQSPIAAPLSLAEALGQQTPQRQPLSLASTLTPPSTPGEFVLPDPSAPVKFSFTLRKADGADLGLNVSHQDTDCMLRVEGVRPEGAVDAWNRQCASSQSAPQMLSKEVRSGDYIVSVNNVSGDPVKMLEECRDKQLLKLCIERNRIMPAAVETTAKATTLRAEASVFVPQSAAPQTPTTGGEADTTTEKDQ